MNYPIANLIFNTLLKGDKLSMVDCGAWGGSLHEWDCLDQFITRYGFDPNADECNRLNAEAKSKGFDHRYFPCFLAQKVEKGRKFYCTNDFGANSLYEPDEELVGRWRSMHLGKLIPTLGTTGTKNVIEVDTLNLDTWARDYNIHDVDFIKLDVQAAELEVLEGGKDLIGSTLGMNVEVWFSKVYKKQPLFADIDVFLRNRGFSFYSFYIYTTSQYVGRMASPVAFPNLTTYEDQKRAGQLVTADSLFLRDPLCEPKIELPMKKQLKLICLAEMCSQVEYCFEMIEFLKTSLEKQGDFHNARLVEAVQKSAGSLYKTQK